MGEPMTDQHKLRWLDVTINVQSLLMAAIAAAAGAVVMWYSLVGRVTTLEEHDRQQELHFTALERSIDQQRNDVKEQLRNISSDVKETNQKIDNLLQQMYVSSAGNRPDTRRWAK